MSETAKPPAQRGKMIVLIVLAGIAALLMFRPVSSPAWGEPGYRPQISGECRAVSASIDVDAPRYISTVCSPEEQREIEGWRPAAD